MAVLAGIVKILRDSANSTSSAVQTGKSTVTTTHGSVYSYRLIFEIDQRIVSIEKMSPILIFDGDEVVVAGAEKADGVLHATAFENITRGVRGNNAYNSWINWISLACALTAGFFWIVALFPLSDEPVFRWIAIAMSILLFACDWFSRDYNRKMTDDAVVVADYAKERLLK